MRPRKTVDLGDWRPPPRTQDVPLPEPEREEPEEQEPAKDDG